MSLPVIDLAPLLHSQPSEKAYQDVCQALHLACLRYGFFYLDISSFASTDETDELRRLAKDFFDLPQETKDLISLSNEDGARGYAKLKENVTNGKADNHEGIDFYRPVPPERTDKSVPLHGTNQWPDEPVDFRPKFEAWTDKMQNLGMIVMKAMAYGLNTSWEVLSSKVDESFWVMRTIGYPPLPEDHDGISCGAHRDYGCLTFLYADPTPNALQVYLPPEKAKVLRVESSLDPLSSRAPNPPSSEHDQESGVWISADPLPNCIVCNIGEMWEIWTKGLYRSTLHRVVHRGSNYRVSIPFFFEPNFDALIEPLDLGPIDTDASKVDSQDPNQSIMFRKAYKPVVYGEFLTRKVGGNFAGGPKKRY